MGNDDIDLSNERLEERRDHWLFVAGMERGDKMRKELRTRAALCDELLKARKDLDEQKEVLQKLVETIRIDHEQSIAPEEHVEGVKKWWKLPGTKAMLDDLVARGLIDG